MIIRFSPEAEEDLLSVWEFSRSQRGEKQADLYLDQILVRIGWLLDNPGLWHARPELGEGVYSYPAERHVIFFRRDKDGIAIACILRGLATHVATDRAPDTKQADAGPK
jgi:toxin ParE1/3/4